MDKWTLESGSATVTKNDTWISLAVKAATVMYTSGQVIKEKKTSM